MMRNLEILASAARTATVNQDVENTSGFKHIHVIVDVTAIALTPSIVVKLQAWDGVSETYYDVLVAAAITTVSQTILKVGVGFPVTANLSANDRMPMAWRVRVEHGDTDSITYSVSAQLME